MAFLGSSKVVPFSDEEKFFGYGTALFPFFVASEMMMGRMMTMTDGNVMLGQSLQVTHPLSRASEHDTTPCREGCRRPGSGYGSLDESSCHRS